jgi:NADH:ubiquinone oxidoreductase subunit H
MTDGRDAGDPEPITGLEVLTPRLRVLLLTTAALVLLGLIATALVPRTLDEGRTLLATEWQLRAAPRLLAPAVTVVADDITEVVRGTRWPGRLQAVQVRLGPDAVAVVGSVPPGADSVRLTTDSGTVHESRLHTLVWHRVHTTVLDGPVTVVEVVAIAADGQVLTVVDDLPVARELSRSDP